MTNDQNLKINLPTDVDELIQLGDAIIKKHVEDGAESTLSASKIAKINFTLAQAREKYREVERYRAMLNESVGELKRLLGNGSKKESSFKQVLKATMQEIAVSSDEEQSANPVFKYILIENGEKKENLEN
ncbi:MAG: hypothetical protein NXI20_01300 [bacterium]|nr:hypothetical protein [bacterium]